MDTLSILLLAMGTALDASALQRVADELRNIPSHDAEDLAALVSTLAELVADLGQPR
jgi:hypothetical protein